MKVKYILITILFIIALPFTMYFIIQLPSVFAIGSLDNWLTFYGSYIGGIIGAATAFIVAYQQIHHQKNSNNKKVEDEMLQSKKILNNYFLSVKEELTKIMTTTRVQFFSFSELNIPVFSENLFYLNRITQNDYVNSAMDIFNDIDRLISLQKAIIQMYKEQNYIQIINSFLKNSDDINEKTINEIKIVEKNKANIFCNVSKNLLDKIDYIISIDT